MTEPLSLESFEGPESPWKAINSGLLLGSPRSLQKNRLAGRALPS
jgi:hypothetical protein